MYSAQKYSLNSIRLPIISILVIIDGYSKTQIDRKECGATESQSKAYRYERLDR